VCERSTEAEDSYIICAACLDDIELRAAELTTDRGQGHFAPVADSRLVPLAPDEIEARLRRLLDDW
jgi:hypothetical protein